MTKTKHGVDGGQSDDRCMEGARDDGGVGRGHDNEGKQETTGKGNNDEQ